MQSDTLPTPNNPNQDRARGLPPVTPPSGRHIVQLFVVPALIVVVALGILWVFERLVGGGRTPEQFSKDLKNPNVEVRWRAASDLAQVLLRDQDLATNPVLALELAGMLQTALRDSETPERAWANSRKNRSEEEAVPNKDLVQQWEYLQYLISSLGRFNLPVGVPLLKEIAAREPGAEDEPVRNRRHQAVIALARLGENLQHYQDRVQPHLAGVLPLLEAQGENSYAQSALQYIKERQENRLTTLGVAQTLAQCSRSDDPLLRKYVALALAFWEGSKEDNALMEETLLRLARDDGHGAETEERRIRGLEIRYKAAEVLARKGSDKIQSQFPLLREMLDEEQQQQIFRTRRNIDKTNLGPEEPDELLVYSTVRGALRGLTELHARQPELDLSSFDETLAKLEKSSQKGIQREAKETRLALGK